jgi:hypothetical protein
MAHWTHIGRLGAAGGLALLASAVPYQVSAATFSGYTGTLDAFASVVPGNVSNQSIPISSSPPDNYGPYSLTAKASASGIFASAEGDASADLEADSLSVTLSGSGSLGGLSGVQVLGYGSSTVDFSILAETPLDLSLNASGLYSVVLSAMNSATPLYSQDKRNALPGTTFAGTIPLVLQPGTYELSAYGSHYSAQAGVIFAGDIQIQLTPAPVPIPAAGWLLGSGLLFLGGLAQRRRRQDASAHMVWVALSPDRAPAR